MAGTYNWVNGGAESPRHDDRLTSAVGATTIPDHADAAAQMLEEAAAQLRRGVPPEGLGPQVALIGRMMARRT